MAGLGAQQIGHPAPHRTFVHPARSWVRIPAARLTPAEARRSRRVVLLLIGILLLSAADLAVTLMNLHTIGMLEANPVARFIIENTNSWGLAAYKTITVFICLSVLYHLRRHVQGEVAAWVGLGILVLLTFYWGHYTSRTHTPDVINITLNGQLDERWLTLAD
jgi:hypothetical protein